MAIVACPECGKKISSQTPVCSNCGFEQGEVSAADLDVFRARKLRDQIYRLNMLSYVAITVFVAGFGWYWWDSAGFSQASSKGPFVLMGLAAVAYLAVRALLFRSRQQRKAMRQTRNMSSELRRNL
jgi:hypothetical protein